MFRRDFINKLTVAGTAATAVAAAPPAELSQVTFRIDGFTCITCAIGLQVVMGKQPGVHRAKASYPEKKIELQFDSSQTNVASLKAFINKTTGFTVAEDKE